MNAKPAAAVESVQAPLFEPFRIGRTTLRNRIVMSPMTRSFSPGGIPTQQVLDYYRRRAAGGAGLLITEGSYVPHVGASNNPANPNLFGEASLEAWAEIIRSVHDAGGRIIPQLWHVGLYHRTGPEGVVQAPEAHHVGPSGLSGGATQPIVKVGEPMTLADIDAVIDAFATAARSAMDIGFDGVELHGAHGYLIDQFLWSVTNLRTDRFGGGLVERSQFAADVIREVRSRTAPDFPIVLRYSQWKQQDYAARLADTPQELEVILAPLVEAGVDLFDCSQRRFWEPAFAGSDLNLAGWTRKLTGKPTMTVGSVGLTSEFLDSMAGERGGVADLGRLLEMFADDQFDLVGVGRAIIADPDWANKVREGRFEALLPFSREALATLY